MREDKPLRAPSLLELSANVVARDDGCLLYEKCSRIPSSSSPTANSSLRYAKNAVVELPMIAADVVVKHVCKNLRNESASTESVTKNLRSFLDGERQPLARLDLSGLNISDRMLAELLAAQQSTLTSLDLSHTTGLNSAGVCSVLTDLKVGSLKLNSLKVTNCDLLRIPRFRLRGMRSSDSHAMHMSNALPVVSQDDLDNGNDFSQSISRQLVALGEELAYDGKKASSANEANLEQHGQVQHFVQFCPNIQHLYLLQGLSYNIEDENADEFLFRIFESLRNLKTLDLSEWHFPNHLHVLENVPNLTTLILYDVQNLENSIPVISGLKNLRCLDLSQSERMTGQYSKPVTCLHTLVTELTNLECLDISGTNLTSAASDDDRPYRGMGLVASDIAGLSFLRRPLKYLGIFNCDNAPHFQAIPAEKICGDHGEDQIILALEVYMSRPRMMQAVLNESYQLYRFSTSLSRHVEALHLVLQALSSHRSNSSLQIAGSASMFYIIRNVKMNRDTKRAVIYALLNGMENHMDEQVMVRNCCLSLCQFEIPQEVLFNYGRTAKLLVRVLEAHSSDQLTQRIVVFLLNSMACHVEGDHKIEVGTIGAIEIILEQIRRKHAAGTCDDVMEVGWSFLWNITDETPANCERFLNAEGLKLFSLCYSQFPNETELVRNMMGLIGNIAEVESLRGQLMDDNYLRIFCTLLDSLADGIEISYNSAGVLAHLVSDGEAAWRGVVRIKRSYVMDEIIRATGTWDLSARRYINYRSFKPILRLLPMFHSPGSQHWAVWALANLTSTDLAKYCRYVEEEGGEELLRTLAYDERSSPKIRELAGIVLTNMETWRRNAAEGRIHENDLEMVDA